MVAPNCWRCLRAPSGGVAVVSQRHASGFALLNGAAASASFPTAITAAAAAAAKFSTTAPLKAKPAPGSAEAAAAQRSAGTKRFRTKKRDAREYLSGKAPLPGERKAFRKRIQLSNNNALAVRGPRPLTAASLADQNSVACMYSLPDALVDQLRAVEAFKPNQSWSFFRNPHTLVRKETVDLVDRMQKSAKAKETLRLVVHGERATGKSMLMLHAMSNAFLQNWVVINIPEAQELSTACNDYAVIPGTEPVLYAQPTYSLNLIKQIMASSGHLLRRMTVLNKHADIPAEVIPHSSSLADLLNTAREADNAWATLRAFFVELHTPSPDRKPILYSLDGLSHIMKISDYRSPDFEKIHSHDLALVRHFIDALSGKDGEQFGFPAGGAVIAATSKGNSPKSFSMELAIAQSEARRYGRSVPQPEPYQRAYDPRVDEALRWINTFRTGTLSRVEARTLMEYWAASGVFRPTVDEKKIADVMALGGNGNIGEMERAALKTMRL